MTKKKFRPPLIQRLTRWIFPRLERWAPGLAVRLFVQLFFTPLHFGFPTKEQPWVNRARRSTLRINGKDVAVYEWGDTGKPLLLFIHGWAGRGTQFREFFQSALDRGFHILAFDGPAHGYSDGKRTSILEFHEVVKQLFERFGVPVGVIGHSFGGTVTLHAAFQDLPVKRVAIIGTPVVSALLIASFLKAVNGSPKTGQAFQRYLIRKYGRDFREFSVEYFLPRLKHPIDLFIVHDEHDKEVSLVHAQEALRLYPSAELMVTHGLGHNRILKDQNVIHRVLDFMQTSA